MNTQGPYGYYITVLTQVGLPVLLSTTFHPNWSRDDAEAIYSATPFFMLTFTDHPTHLIFQRNRLDQIGLWVSAVTFASLITLTCWFYRGLPTTRIKKP